MARTVQGSKVFIPQEILDVIDPRTPPGLTRSDWVRLLIHIGLQHEALGSKRDND